MRYDPGMRALRERPSARGASARRGVGSRAGTLVRAALLSANVLGAGCLGPCAPVARDAAPPGAREPGDEPPTASAQTSTVELRPASTATRLTDDVWHALGDGLEVRRVPPEDPESTDEDEVLELFRIDPSRARIRVLGADALGLDNLTAAAWADRVCREHAAAGRGVAVLAVNAGLFDRDHRRHVGLLRIDGKAHTPTWVKSYKSALVLDPRAPDAPRATLVDVDDEGARAGLDRWGTVVQNLRIVRAPGESVWNKDDAVWSELALGLDREGRLIIAFQRAPSPMRRFVERLIAEAGVVRAQHLEGGPWAAYALHVDGARYAGVGTFERGFVSENDAQWPIPNVLTFEAPRPGLGCAGPEAR
jgi:hypothetical protein